MKEMKELEFKRRLYLRPEISVIEVDEEQFICKTSVVPKVPGSTEEDWGDEDVEIGEETL